MKLSPFVGILQVRLKFTDIENLLVSLEHFRLLWRFGFHLGSTNLCVDFTSVSKGALIGA